LNEIATLIAAGFTHSEIGERLGLSMSQVASRMADLRAEPRAQLAKDER
jgi:DNA-directed RNA polymerase specialized sigma24 family protein